MARSYFLRRKQFDKADNEILNKSSLNRKYKRSLFRKWPQDNSLCCVRFCYIFIMAKGGSCRRSEDREMLWPEVHYRRKHCAIITYLVTGTNAYKSSLYFYNRDSIDYAFVLCLWFAIGETVHCRDITSVPGKKSRQNMHNTSHKSTLRTAALAQ